MRFALFLFIFFVIADSLGQNRPVYYDYFDYESSSNAYDYSKSLVENEGIKGNIKEVKIYSASGRIDFHVKLNKKKQIIEFFEYDPESSKLLRIKLFENNRLIVETGFNPDGAKEYVKYLYDRNGKIVSIVFSASHRKFTTEITSHYNSSGQLTHRDYDLTRGLSKTSFYYEGDSVTWMVSSEGGRSPKGALKKFLKFNCEIITSYRLDTLSDAPFKDRLLGPYNREFLTRWDSVGNIIERSEFEYDSMSKKTIRRVERYAYDDNNRLSKSDSYYNTNLLSGLFSNEYKYNDRGLLEIEIWSNIASGRITKREYEYDQHGNILLFRYNDQSKSFRYTYDHHGNWILKEYLVPDNNLWLIEARREFTYFD